MTHGKYDCHWYDINQKRFSGREGTCARFQLARHAYDNASTFWNREAPLFFRCTYVRFDFSPGNYFLSSQLPWWAKMHLLLRNSWPMTSKKQLQFPAEIMGERPRYFSHSFLSQCLNTVSRSLLGSQVCQEHGLRHLCQPFNFQQLLKGRGGTGRWDIFIENRPD